jgi:hypothetical protein
MLLESYRTKCTEDRERVAMADNVTAAHDEK